MQPVQPDEWMGTISQPGQVPEQPGWYPVWQPMEMNLGEQQDAAVQQFGRRRYPNPAGALLPFLLFPFFYRYPIYPPYPYPPYPYPPYPYPPYPYPYR
ncbi:hypothetical protein [Rubeoparvulum massiliense]|uniref:hypothetical protein n=1 Tax=Rubeoparvulum massiliense TaxID=1631346 RepID=UPI00065E89D7|nr:hypothetical protein [Rubeoparvulum massiliense]